MLRFCFLCMLLLSSLFAESFAQTTKPISLSLEEAIMLAIRENPNVQQTQLAHVQEKFALDVANWQFKPHYYFNAAQTVGTAVIANVPQPTSHSLQVNPGLSWNSKIGTQVSVTNLNNITICIIFNIIIHTVIIVDCFGDDFKYLFAGIVCCFQYYFLEKRLYFKMQ